MAEDGAHNAVLLTAGAEQDLEALHEYVAEADGPRHADRLLERLMAAVEGLQRFPGRCSFPRELANLGIREYRQVHFKPYRILYRMIGANVVYAIVDGRRDMQALLSRRLLGR
jgi:toxin ParE1/3/4